MAVKPIVEKSLLFTPLIRNRSESLHYQAFPLSYIGIVQRRKKECERITKNKRSTRN